MLIFDTKVSKVDTNVFKINPNSKQMEVTLKLFTTNEEFDTEYIDSIFYLSIFNKTLT